jgi:hypothetical protein
LGWKRGPPFYNIPLDNIYAIIQLNLILDRKYT